MADVCVIRKGDTEPILAPFDTLAKGDTFFSGGNAYIVGTDAHYSGDASYDGYLLYDANSNDWYPEDLDTDLEELRRSLSGFVSLPGTPERWCPYRGKRVDTGEWVEGFYHFSTWYLNGKPTHISHYIRPVGCGDAYQVDPATVCQYIGRRDNQRTEEYPEGKMLFSGDIIKHFNVCDDPAHYEIGIIEWNSEKFCWANRDISTGECYTISNSCNYVVIGNIYDTPIQGINL